MLSQRKILPRDDSLRFSKNEIIIPTSNVAVTISPTNRFGIGLRGAHAQEDRSTNEVGRFLSSVRFESRGKLEEIGVGIDKNL
jgi:hypothetical protein